MNGNFNSFSVPRARYREVGGEEKRQKIYIFGGFLELWKKKNHFFGPLCASNSHVD